MIQHLAYVLCLVFFFLEQFLHLASIHYDLGGSAMAFSKKRRGASSLVAAAACARMAQVVEPMQGDSEEVGG